MAYSYTTRNGQRVEVNVAAAFDKMAAAFKQRFGLNLIVSSGTRTRAEQQRLYNGWINRLPGYNLAAPPGQSNHEESGPRGPRALDLRDSGRDAGVTSFGTTRGNWLAANAHRWGFTQAGASFSPREAWHYEYNGKIGGSGSGGGGSTSSSQKIKNIQSMLNKTRGEKLAVDGINGPATKAAVKRYQNFLRKYGYKGAIDGIWGEGTELAHRKAYAARMNLAVDGKKGPKTVQALQRRLGVTDDGIEGPATIKALQKLLKVAVDGKKGPNTIKALQRRLGVTADGIEGPNTIKAIQRKLNDGSF